MLLLSGMTENVLNRDHQENFPFSIVLNLASMDQRLRERECPLQIIMGTREKEQVSNPQVFPTGPSVVISRKVFSPVSIPITNV